MAPRPRVLVVQHEDDCPPGLVEPWLRRAGLDCDVLQAYEGRAIPAALTEHVALLVLGGRMGAYDDAGHPWLAPTKALIAGTVAGGHPFLGVCLGHQLAAVALGGEVAPNPAGQTIALLPWRPTSQGRQDELTGSLLPGTSLLHWNTDVAVQLPRRATPLATAPDGTVQAARFAPHAWGVQFHPEVTAEMVASWAEGRHPEKESATLAALRRHQGSLHRAWEQLFRRFGRLVLVHS